MRYERELDGPMTRTSERRKTLTILMRRRQAIRTYVTCIVIAALLFLVAGVAVLISR
jgi:heme O synthase-like polyprenyltransferase